MSFTHYITVEGPIGIGKTSLARTIQQAFQFQLLEEIVEENPFLGRFYENIEEWAFQTEMFFLCNRYKQLRDIHQSYLSQGLSVVSDYNIFKNTIFAHRTLSASELSKYIQIYDVLTHDMPQASLIIYLNASIDTLMHRISKRGRPFEQDIDRQYLVNLREDYDRFITRFHELHPEVPILMLDGDKLDFVAHPEDLKLVLDQIRTLLPKESFTHAKTISS